MELIKVVQDSDLDSGIPDSDTMPDDSDKKTASSDTDSMPNHSDKGEAAEHGTDAMGRIVDSEHMARLQQFIKEADAGDPKLLEWHLELGKGLLTRYKDTRIQRKSKIFREPCSISNVQLTSLRRLTLRE
ncbi:hypothetical protein B0H13DRAFT_1852903 [Mycena leptocephala]|nr:hypothetical protein B0H13DRAFT_1852903 [Mycena leptocephala]